ncbi:sporulation protein [Priestia aryabhattai]|uniref:sporulation protein n=1 Tax=Priestia aryabhattai TaxID=412384 RepID=UPI000BEFB116|nr:sporulation protein [Priestia aryabhattai]MED3948422.1 sporulation protein [Priestia aryabhattai]MED4022285.1 sporulation protein [Priestia aryabhattai]PEI55750.1 sporulation protein [Priestia aryabhattai]PHF67157.1 sporulation protein [Priestia aryabhattai]
MFKKMFAKMGVGAAKVDLRLNETAYTLGHVIEGAIFIQGGNVQQHINLIDVEFWLEVQMKSGQMHTHRVESLRAASAFTINEGEKKEIPFTYHLPLDLPISASNVSYFFKTHLDIEGGVDSTDRDPVRIKAPESLYQLVEGFETLGFREKHHSGKFNGYKQEFAFFPTDFLKGYVNEVEFEVAIEREGIRMLLELDLPSFGREREIKNELFFTNDELSHPSTIARLLEEAMEEMMENPRDYEYYKPSHYDQHSHHPRMSGLGGAMGGFAAGMLGGLLIENLIDDMFEDSALGEIGEDIEEAGEDLLDGDFFDGGDDW